MRRTADIMKTIRNHAQREIIIARINKLNGDEKPLWGKMTADQMISHLVQATELPFVETVADRSNLVSRIFIKPLILYCLTMPKEVKVSPDLNQQENGRKPQGFDVDKAVLLNSIEKLGTLPTDHKCLAHPFFGKMTAKEWAIIAHKHIDHHLKQFGV